MVSVSADKPREKNIIENRPEREIPASEISKLVKVGGKIK